jgi:hypothetical protein
VICERDAFLQVDGYDTAYEGWGGEDDDFYTLLEFAGIKAGSIDGHGLSEIPHPDEMRTRFHSEGKTRSLQRNQLYRMAKFDLMRLNRSFMPLALRQQVYSQIKAKLKAQYALGKSEMEVEIILPKASFELPVASDKTRRRSFTNVGRKLQYSINWDQ